jgi:acyl carrier protein phosphodiesterase
LQSFSRFLRREQVLASYRRWRGVELSLQRIARHSPRFAPIADAMPAVLLHETSLLRGFEAFFPDLVTHVQSLHTNGHGVTGHGADDVHNED